MGVSTTSGSTVKLGGSLDVRSVALARTTLHGALDRLSADGGTEMAVDMASIEAVDAAGLGMLTALHLRCERQGVRLVLRSCPRDVRRLLAVTRLNRLLHIDRSEPALTA